MMDRSNRMEVKARDKGNNGWFFACKNHHTAVTTTARGRAGWEAMWEAMEDHAAEHHARPDALKALADLIKAALKPQMKADCALIIEARAPEARRRA